MPNKTKGPFAAAWLIVGLAAANSAATAQNTGADPRLKELWYDPQAVITVPVKRGIVTHLMLDAGEAITDVGSGLGADCSKPEASWCIAAQVGGRNIFVKPKTLASGPNNLAVVTDKRSHAFRFVLLADGDVRQPIYRLLVKAPAARDASVANRPNAMLVSPTQIGMAPLEPMTERTAERTTAPPDLVNVNYAIAEGRDSQDIVPTLVFDDGRFTYFRFPGNAELPAVFHVQGDGTESLVNARMAGELLVADRVSRRLMLRAGSAVVGVWNEAFDLDGRPPIGGSTVAGLRRTLKVDERADEARSLP
ncbi:TrbG/VirB9 family P-type conjugative transfer protein [Roseateles oligotrophus]|uniref:TrbG/VirB9 family P-type conjugative transfer protein n=1 Tax=Roseateles oligotrophus TaxID=1769250 RepID=A0ABT2Y9K0_9BURK|nr:TrbG/VirB9 family P-type conjugative transfer protein [Roseateles oligotrophus]MCV2366982.1 TrbG/VirB9 family P-type conjugative transfer protein [Roseateles oligotrophus]